MSRFRFVQAAHPSDRTGDNTALHALHALYDIEDGYSGIVLARDVLLPAARLLVAALNAYDPPP